MMRFYNNKRFDKLDDRELLELILMNQVNIYQMLYRANHYALKFLPENLAEYGIHKDEAYEKMLHDADAFLQQYAQMIDEKKDGFSDAD